MQYSYYELRTRREDEKMPFCAAIVVSPLFSPGCLAVALFLPFLSYDDHDHDASPSFLKDS